jgi:hypothetical protein
LLSGKPEFSPVASFEELWSDCAQAIYGDSCPPLDFRQWFLIGAAALFEVLDRMAEKLDAGESDDVTGERVNQLRQHLRLACASPVPSDSLPFNGRPN